MMINYIKQKYVCQLITAVLKCETDIFFKSKPILQILSFHVKHGYCYSLKKLSFHVKHCRFFIEKLLWRDVPCGTYHVK